MLKEIIGDNMVVVCNNCQAENSYNVSEKTVSFSPEFNEFENLNFECPGCHTIEIFNMNIPANDTDENFMSGDLPIGEEIQRYYVRLLMRIARPDLT